MARGSVRINPQAEGSSRRGPRGKRFFGGFEEKAGGGLTVGFGGVDLVGGLRMFEAAGAGRAR
jgi:hypothetical protein